MKKPFFAITFSLFFLLFPFTSHAFFPALSTHASCPAALATTNVNFCSSFKTAATCYCTSSGLPSGMCQDMKAIYDRMINIFGSQRKACEYQKNTPVQTCMDDWDCYHTGGNHGGLCSSTGKACEKFGT